MAQLVRTMWMPGTRARYGAWSVSLFYLSGGSVQWLMAAAGWQAESPMRGTDEAFDKALTVFGCVLTAITVATGMLPGPRNRRLLRRGGVRVSADVLSARWVGRSLFGDLLMEVVVRVHPPDGASPFDGCLVVATRRWPPRKQRPLQVCYDRADPRRMILAH